MDKLISETLALILMFLAFPLVSMGSTGSSSLLLSIGLLCMIAGGALPIMTRFMDHSRDKVRDMGVEYDDRAS